MRGVMKTGTIEDLTLPESEGLWIPGQVSPGPHFSNGADRRINVAYITTMRELMNDERVGQTRYAGKRLVGTAEHMANELQQESDFERLYNLVLIVAEDVEGYRNGEDYLPPFPAGRPWDEDAYTVVRNGGTALNYTLDSLVHNHASMWKAERKDVEKRREMKIEWEEGLSRLLDKHNVDVLLSDSLMTIFGLDIPEDRGMFNRWTDRMLNVHPAITEGKYALLGDTPTVDALTRAHHGYVDVRDEVTGKRYRKSVEPRNRTGASLFVIDRGIDTGKVIMDLEATMIFREDTPDSLRLRNYLTKNLVVVQGLIKYASMPEYQDSIRLGREQRQTDLYLPGD